MKQIISTENYEIEISVKEKAIESPVKTVMLKVLNDYSWAEILQSCKDGSYKTHFKVGDEKEIPLANGEILTVAIAGFDMDENEKGETIPITFTPVNCLEEDCPMTDMPVYLKRLYDERIPQTLKEVITPVKKGDDVTPFFLHSEMEIFGKTIYSDDTTVKQYPYYQKKNNRCKFKNSKDYAAFWWERSARYNNSYNFSAVYSNGSAYSNDANISLAVAPAFCVG